MATGVSAFFQGEPAALLSLLLASAVYIAQVQPTGRVAMVGAFVPFMSPKGQMADLWIVDKRPEALR